MSEFLFLIAQTVSAVTLSSENAKIFSCDELSLSWFSLGDGNVHITMAPDVRVVAFLCVLVGCLGMIDGLKNSFLLLLSLLGRYVFESE